MIKKSNKLSGVLGVALMLTPSVAWANTNFVQDEITPAFWVALSMAVVASIIALWSILRNRETLLRANEAEAIIQFTNSVIEGGALAYMTIHEGKTCYCSPRLGRWLGISEATLSLNRFEQISGEVTADHALAGNIFNSIKELVRHGTPFTNTYSPPKMNLIYLARGVRVQNEIHKNRQYDVVFFSNVTELGQGQNNLTEQLSKSLKAQSMLNQILDLAPFPVWSRQKDLSLNWVNQAYATAVEKLNNAKVLETQAELVVDANERPLQKIAKYAVEEKQEQIEKHHVIINGDRRSLQLHEFPIFSSEYETVGFAVDITQEEFLKAELDQHKTAHAETLDKLSTPVAIFGPDQSLRFYNNAFLNLWQLNTQWLDEEPTHSELLEALRDKKQLPEQADFPAWKKHILAHYTGLFEPSEETWYLPNGKALRVVTQPHPIGGILVLFEDVTDRLALESSYNTLIEVQRETLDNLHEAVALFGSDGRLKLFNANYAKLWQIEPSYLESEPHLKDVLIQNKNLLSTRAKEWETLQHKLINATATRHSYSDSWSLKDGKVIEISVVPLPDGASLFTFSDETSNVKMTLALEEKNQAVLEADRIKSEFISNMSYELRTPLNSIMGFSEMLNLENYGPLNEKQKDYIDAILSSSVTLKNLIDNILDLSIIEAGKMDLEIEKFDFQETLNDAIEMFNNSALVKKTKIHHQIIENKDTWINGDKTRITKAIFTLLSELSKTGHTKNPINIDLTLHNDYVSVIFEKTDPIKEQSADDNFIGKSKIGKIEKDKSLGLSIVHSFVRLHGGKLNLHETADGLHKIVCDLPREHPLIKEGS